MKRTNIRNQMQDGSGRGRHRRRQSAMVLPAVLIVCVSLAVLAGVSLLSDESSAAICDDVTVYVERPDGKYDKTVVSGVSTVQGAIESALTKLKMTWEYGSENKFISVNGRTLDDDHYWRIHQWLPLGTAGWGVMGYDQKSNSFMQSGCSYCLHVSTLSSVDGTNVYSSPDFQPKSTGYVFIRFANGFDEGNLSVTETFTADVRAKGFWLKGTGSSMGEVLKDAVESQGLDVELKTGIDGNGNDLQCWIISMFGLGDVYMDNGVWAYWSQWTWVNHSWYYNDWTLGYYDPAVYKYVECIYLISTPDPYGDGYAIDKGGPEPNPDTDDIVLINNYNKVTFKVGNKTVSTQTVKYGRTADISKVPVPEAPEGMVFAGWGDVMKPITNNTTFTAQFTAAGQQFTVRYYDETRTVLLHTEKVNPGASATYSGQPSKPEDDHYTYTFRGWSSDLSNITADIDVTPIFDATPKGGGNDPTPVHTHSWGPWTIVEHPTCTESGLRTRTCSCGEVRTERVAATGHQWSEWVVEREPSPTADGSKYRTCSVCNEVQRSAIVYIGTEPREIKGDLSTTTIVLQDDNWIVECTLTPSTEMTGSGMKITITPGAISQAIEQMNSVDDGSHAVSSTITIQADSGNAGHVELSITPEEIRMLSDVGKYKLEYEAGSFRMTVESEVLSAIGGKASLSFSGNASVPSGTMSGVSNGYAVDITLRSDDSDIHELGGTVTVSIPYKIPASENAEDLKVWYVDGTELKEVDATYDAATGTVSFGTDHLSQWIVGFKKPAGDDSGGENNNTILYVAIGIVAVIAVVAVLVVRK